MSGNFPESFRDPLYSSLDLLNEKKLGLPAGLVSSVREYGERTNASKVSSAGATTPYQFIPATRKAILQKYGIDVSLSPQNASEGAALLLKENLDRNNGSVEDAIGEFHAGPNRDNWGPINESYRKRVLNGFQSNKIKSLSNDFSKWLQQNPVAAPAPAPEEASPQVQSLDADFATWLAAPKDQSGAVQIPSEDPAFQAQYAAGETPQQVEARNRTVGDAIVGTGEAALTGLTGAVGGTIGGIGGTAAGLVQSIQNGTFGTAQGANNVERAAAQGAEALTYAPRTTSGQEQAQALGEVAQLGLPIAPLAGEAAALANASAAARPSVQAAGSIARGAAAQGAQGVADAFQQAASKIRQATGFGEEATSSSTGRGSAGAAGVDLANQRRATAEGLPVPVDLTLGEATGDVGQISFERNAAKGAAGEPIRARSEQTNAKLSQNFEKMIDDVGAVTSNNTEAGRVLVDETLRPAAARLKNEYRAKYNAAEKAGETQELVSLQPLADYLNSNRAGRTSAPILQTIADELKVREVGQGALADGSIVGGEASLSQAEAIRKAVNKFVKDQDPNDVRVGTEIKSVIDSITEGKGGELFKEARQARKRYAELFEDNAIVSDLLKTKRGTSDRQVALENVFRRTVLNGDRESLRMLRRTLGVSDQKAGFAPGLDGPGAQAWREVQGATLRHLLDESTKNSVIDGANNRVFSAAGLDSAVRALERGEKLDFILGKKAAQTVRDINEISRVVKTFPPNHSINTSNSGVVILQALGEAGATGALTGLPVPVLSLLKAASAHVKDRKVRQRVAEALRTSQSRERAPGQAAKTF